MIGLLLIAALGIGYWAWRKHDLRALRFGDVAAAVAVLIGLRLFTRGETLQAIAAIGGAAYWVWLRRGKSAPAAMDRGEAGRLLAVAPDATPEAIRAAHRRLVARVHPDVGGSAELTARLNAARDTLLAARR